MEAPTKGPGRLTSVIRSVLAAIPEASLWTAVGPAVGGMVATQTGLRLTFPFWVAGVAGLVGGVLGGLWLPAANGALFVAAGLVGGAAILSALGGSAAVVWLFAFWRGVSAAAYGRYPDYLRRAVKGVLIAFGAFGLLFARAGFPLPALLMGLFVAAATGLGALLLWADSTIIVGLNTYAIPHSIWHHRVASAAIASVIGLSAILLSAWTVWAGPAASGLSVLGQTASIIAGVFFDLFLKVLVVLMIPVFWLIGLLVAWLQGRGRAFTPTQGLLAGENALPDWLKQAAEKPTRSWSIPAFVILGALAVLAAVLIYRLVRSVVVAGAQELATEFEDLTPTNPSRKKTRVGDARRRNALAGLPPVRAAYRSFLFRLAAIGRPRAASITPMELSARLGAELGAEGREEVNTLTTAYIEARYGPPGRVDSRTERRAIEAWRFLRARLFGSGARAGKRARSGKRAR